MSKNLWSSEVGVGFSQISNSMLSINRIADVNLFLNIIRQASWELYLGCFLLHYTTALYNGARKIWTGCLLLWLAFYLYLEYYIGQNLKRWCYKRYEIMCEQDAWKTDKNDGDFWDPFNLTFLLSIFNCNLSRYQNKPKLRGCTSLPAARRN